MTVKVLTGLVPLSPPDYLEWFDLASRPLLELASKNAAPAISPKVEWLGEEKLLEGSRTEGRARYGYRVITNFTQILRRTIQPEWLEEKGRLKGRLETFTEATRRAGNEILDDVESILWYGKPSYEAGSILHMPLSKCGGVLHYLRRRVYENDTVSLRPLCSLMLRDYRDFYDVNASGEWLWEFSLQVNRGHYQRGMKPLFLPPALKQPVKAWRQGSTLSED